MTNNNISEVTGDAIDNDNLKDTTKIKAVIKDEDNAQIPIPIDAEYVEGKESTGVVIKYKNSEFVWVPVPVTAENSLYVKGTTKPMSAETTSGDKWYGMYQKQKNFTTSTDKMQAEMIWGSQYDAMLNWGLEVTDKSHIRASNNALHNYSDSSSLLTRTTTENDTATGLDRINNIYDLEGILYEWTQEAGSTYSRVFRGGCYSLTVSPSTRYNDFPSGTYARRGSRLSLYIK